MIGICRLVVIVFVAAVASGCTASDPGEQTIQSETTTIRLTTSTTSQPVTTLPPEPPQTSAPAVADLPLETVEVEWPEPKLVGELNAISIAGVVPGSQSLVFVEERAQVQEGCEGGIEPLGRLVLQDLNDATRKILIPELRLNDTRFYLGPNNRLAMLGGCDANAWLEAVGSLTADGTIDFQRLDPERQVRMSNNSGVSVTWTADGDTLFVNSIRVDAATGLPLEPLEQDPPVRVHAVLSDGTRLISARPTGANDSFWIVDDQTPLDEPPPDPPDFVAQALYPAVQVRISNTGSTAYATFTDWESDTVHTVIIGDGELQQIPGEVWPSPSGTRLLVRDRSTIDGRASWLLVDPEAATSTSIPLPESPGNNWFDLSWAGSDTELLISARSNEYKIGDPTTVWIQSTQ